MGRRDGRQIEQLVHTVSEDGYTLDGVVLEPLSAQPNVAFVLIHGAPGNFYGPVMLPIAHGLAARGYLCLSGNTKGHDAVSMAWRADESLPLGKRMAFLGAWREDVAQSSADIAAWVALVAAEWQRDVVLVGVSFGGVRVIHYQAARRDPRVVGLALGGCPVRAHRRLDPERLAVARKMVAEGNGHTPVPPAGRPGEAGDISAQTYISWWDLGLDVFGVDSPNPPISKIGCPVFACYGSREGGAEDFELIRRNATSAERVDTYVVEGSEHGFFGHSEEVATALAGWAASLETAKR